MRIASVTVVAPVSVTLALRQGGRETVASCCDTSHPVFWYVPGVAKCLDGLWLFLSSVRTVARLKRRFGFDLIDAHFGYPDGFAAAVLGLVFRRPFVVTFRGSELVMARFSARRAALRFVAKRASRVVAVSTELEQLAHDLGADKRRTIVIGNGVDVDQFAPIDRSIARGRLGCFASGSVVLCVGHLARVKRFDLVLDAFSTLRNRNLDVTLAIVGGDGAVDRGYGETLKARARALGLKDAVLFPGAVDPSDVSLWMNAADVLVLPSEREGSPNVVLEALASGTPVVASDVGDVRRLINSSNGVLMSSNPTREDVADAIAAVLEHRWDRHRIRETVASQTWRAVGERVVSTWRAAVIGAPQAHGVAAQC